MVADKAIASYFEDVLAAGATAKSAANWIIGNLFSLSNRDGIERETIGEKVSAANLAALIKLVDSGTINKATGVEVLADMWDTGSDPAKIVAAKGLGANLRRSGGRGGSRECWRPMIAWCRIISAAKISCSARSWAWSWKSLKERAIRRSLKMCWRACSTLKRGKSRLGWRAISS